MDKADIEKLESLREEWAKIANAIETIYGDSEPSARAIRHCISTLYSVYNDD